MFKKQHNEQLRVGNFVLRADKSDAEIITRLGAVSWTYAPIGGLGGELGWLDRDIQAGRATIPGRTRYRSHELVHEAFQRSWKRQRQLDKEMRKDARRLWWSTRGILVAVAAVMLGLFAAAMFFHEELFSLITGAAAGTEPAAAAGMPGRIYDAMWTYVAPCLIVATVLSACVAAVAHLFRLGSNR